MNEYEKKYNSLVGQIKKAYLNAQTDSTKDVLEDILPSLKESEDDRIRKELIKFLQECHNIDSGFFTRYCKVPYEQMIAWLEKQGEQKPQRMVSAETKEALYDKLSWSEEDETVWTNTIIMLKEGASLHFVKRDIENSVDWLKSLKDRVGCEVNCTTKWKPSEEQMRMLKRMITAIPLGEVHGVLETLYDDLNKLMDE